MKEYNAAWEREKREERALRKWEKAGPSPQKVLKVKDAPAVMRGAPLPDPAKVAARLLVERELARPKYAEFQPSLMPDVPDDTGQTSLF